MICNSHLFKNFPQVVVIHTVKGVSVVNEADLDLGEIFLAFSDTVDVDNLISCSSAFYKTNLNIWKLMALGSLKPCLDNFKHYFTSV